MGIVLVVLFMGILQVVATSAQAQKFDYFNRNSKLMVGVGSSLGTRSFSIKSDITAFNNLKGTQQGWESFMIVGRNTLKFRTGFGSFKTDLIDANSIKQSSISGLANIYVLDMIGKGKKIFHPYVITGIGVNIYQFSGTAVPEGPLTLPNPQCKCTCPLTPVTDLGVSGETVIPVETLTPTSEISDQEPAIDVKTAKMTYTQIVSGLGAEASFFKNGRFFTLFGEARYGLPIGVTTQSSGLNNTQIKNQMALTFGIAFGISNSTSKGFKNNIR